MRADQFLHAEGYFPSRSMAQAAIAEGKVRIDGSLIRRPAEQIASGAHEVSVADPMPYVSRGGMKLAGALDTFGIAVSGCRAIDIGASTGGFTDCLLQRGAVHVTAIDAGEGQLHPSLRADARVRCLEHCNARELDHIRLLSPPYDLAVMDVSFISQTYILPRFPAVLSVGGQAVTLIKPQFEAGRAALGSGGIVRRAEDRLYAVCRVLDCAAQSGLRCAGLIRSPIDGGDGNREYLAHFLLEQIPLLPPSHHMIRAMFDACEKEKGTQ